MARLIPIVFTMLASAVFASADPVIVGSLVFGNPLSTTQGFEVINETGPSDGCDAGNLIPVCTILTFENTSLTVTFADHSTVTKTPSGGFSFGPGGYIYGDNATDDQNQSFLFDNSLSITSATFTGMVVPGSFLVTDGTNLSNFDSTGLFSATLDLSGGEPLAAADISVDSPGGVLPEPASFTWILAALLSLVAGARFVARANGRRS